MLSSSRSCLALCEFNDIDRCLGSNSMSSKVLSQSYSDSALRKDSGCGNGFVESQVGIQAEATRTVLPLSFTVIPPLEQRRQRVSCNLSFYYLRIYSIDTCIIFRFAYGSP